MNQKPRVSVFIPSYNHAVYIGEAIESVLGQTLGDFELIIVDDGSTDNSWELIERYAKSDSRIIAIRQENQGPSAATNRALSQAKGDFIAAHTSDDRSISTRLEKQVAFLDAHAEYDAVASFIEGIDGNGQIYMGGQYEIWFNVLVDLNNPSSWVWNNRVASPTLMLRRGFFERYGFYDRDLIHTQDWEMWIRALSIGGKFGILPEKLLQYRSHGDNLTQKDATKLFWEYAYISSKTLHPWLMGTGSDSLVLGNIVGFLRHEVFIQLNQNERDALASILIHNFRGTFRDFFLSRNDDRANHRIEAKVIEAYGQMELEGAQLRAEGAQLRAEGAQ
ncbi:MAG: glycosyltransferase, partial [Nitrospira sp.]